MAGPAETIRMIKAINAISGSSSGSATATRTISSLRFQAGFALAGFVPGI